VKRRPKAEVVELTKLKLKDFAWNFSDDYLIAGTRRQAG
jgi:hypothetical protein